MKKPIEAQSYCAGDACADIGNNAGHAVRRAGKQGIVLVVGVMFLVVFALTSMAYGFARGLFGKGR